MFCCSNQSRRYDYQEGQPWEFAQNYSLESLIKRQDVREKFFKDLISWEAKFFNGPGVHPSGFTRDGVFEDGTPRDWSAPSKEALHLSLLALRMNKPVPLCEQLMSYDEALSMLKRKADCYDSFRKRHPLLHGFMPWFNSSTGDPVDASNPSIQVPCLDNGQFAWALYAVTRALQQAGELELSARFQDHLAEMASNAVSMAYQGNGSVAANVRMKILSSGKAHYEPVGDDVDPWESEVFPIFLDLLGDFKAAGYDDPEKEKALIWSNPARLHRIRPALLELGTGGVDILVCAGWHFSSHELWKYLSLPYCRVDSTRRTLLNGEIARTHFLAKHRVPGMIGSCTGPDANYHDNVGIAEGISDLDATCTDLLTPYGVFPTLLASEGIGAAWLKTMLECSGMQTELGASESCHSDGSAVCSVKTWDAKITTVVAVLGGGNFLEAFLREDALWTRFTWILDSLYSEKFGKELPGADLPLALPTATLGATQLGGPGACPMQ